jgi:hypothetical protein
MALEKSAELNAAPVGDGSLPGGDPMRDVSEDDVSALTRARQQAQNALLRARLENRSARALAAARQRAQRAADILLAARLATEYRTPVVSSPSRRRGAQR